MFALALGLWLGFVVGLHWQGGPTQNVWWVVLEHTVCKVRGHRVESWVCLRCWEEVE